SEATKLACSQNSRQKNAPNQSGRYFLRGTHVCAAHRLATGALRVAQGLDLVMVALHALHLTLDYRTHVHRQVFLERFTVALEGNVFATLALVEDGFVVLAGDHRLQVHPATVHVASGA